MIMKLLSKLYPKEKDFYRMLYEQSSKTLEGIKQLRKYMETGLEEDGKKIIVFEREADELRRILIDELNRTFITPLEREDIFNLSRAIDDMIDYSRSTFEEMQVFELRPTDKTRNMVNLLVEAAEEINNAVNYLKDHHEISAKHAVKAKSLENQVEREYRKVLAELVKGDDIEYILKMREIFRHMSNLADKIDYAADIIGHIIVKIS